ncbi:MAG: hypothetical protein AB1513_03560 [Pseudomonadota bacterium]
MAKDEHMRRNLAHLAARLMAQDGIVDFALAKRKAARQLGAPQTRNLPSNEEVEEALRAYQNIYQGDEQRARLAGLRRTALAVMHDLAPFDPHLTGPILSGSAGRYAGIELQVFADNVKEVELFLLNRQIRYLHGEQRLLVGNSGRIIPLLTLERDGVEVHLAVLSRTDLHTPARTNTHGKAMERARTAQVEALLAGKA